MVYIGAIFTVIIILLVILLMKNNQDNNEVENIYNYVVDKFEKSIEKTKNAASKEEAVRTLDRAHILHNVAEYVAKQIDSVDAYAVLSMTEDELLAAANSVMERE